MTALQNDSSTSTKNDMDPLRKAYHELMDPLYPDFDKLRKTGEKCKLRPWMVTHLLPQKCNCEVGLK